MEILTIIFSLLFYGYAFMNYRSDAFIFYLTIGTILFIVSLYFAMTGKNKSNFSYGWRPIIEKY